MSQRDGGPAFPSFDRGDSSDFEGMTLRDYFAGQALAGLTGNQSPDRYAEDAYCIADAMLAARVAQPKEEKNDET